MYILRMSKSKEKQKKIMAPRTNINQNARTNGSTSRPLINAVNTGRIGSSNLMIAPRPENMSIPVSDFNDVVSLLATLNDKMTDVSSDVSELKVQCQVGAQSTGMQAVLDSDMDPQDIINSSRHPKISNIIWGRLRDINFKTDDLELIRENDDKPTWDVNVGLSDEFNKNLASELMLYIRRQPVAAMIPPKELCGIILNKKRKRTYTKHKDAGTEKFNWDYNGVFYRDAMSGDETETNTSVVASRPDWRSDEIMFYIKWFFCCLIPDLARDDLGKRATQLKSQSHVLIHKTIPRGLVTKMSAWSKRI
ncbi:hypothetical protein PHYBLDRAFT_163548 [Phycomyces blakesleeanus NRRL 1555(-)]|uniref:Uncharacterized protein n=1 Tax=Phycomyces blakesleeanus (strain ATCC 8743b / DSM 1359 / FGSC 10004 / NBRC 33097 / NRRL 1555) TaxID=763407 RepID=A0A162ZNB9_PHYB8|nr:hypothetical protein PHYBLDRAFT_173921 [Phycomyces blakesleeanus NRRL 1555(-)]XP_018296477.1 hypothetical protein PHYBLDRAFT_163548 [Phycomyces blakesleeanus NRRL 1555(-)]OAD68011.1 hypothetical protein PHYBLDRAFT_173921 [Phycomyces blakesleeanus NRRL 1555(-)]OAD78437.1 hypothetical protein PHYBLDRAFT_163548 [Phycomyces blakesleeanus NRRL 1555(-)]|eukprot:XP_018286051.1 hypothetical protein PHYBLDRAFT_173921 [Phycomyces blakesleeanus NRRL 1555(-)]